MMDFIQLQALVIEAVQVTEETTRGRTSEDKLEFATNYALQMAQAKNLFENVTVEDLVKLIRLTIDLIVLILNLTGQFQHGVR